MVVSLYRPWGQRTTFLQQNTYNFNSGWGSSHHCCGGGRGNGGLWAAFGITAGLSLLSNIFGGGNRGTQMTSQYGGYQPYGMMPFDYASFNRYNNPQVPGNQNSTSSTLDNLNKFYSDYTWIYQDGKIYGKNKETGEVVEGETFEELQSKISGTSSRLQNNSGNKFTEQEAANLIKGAGLEDKIKIEDGKLSYTLPDGTEVQERFAELTETNVGKAIAIMLAGTTGADPADATEETDTTTDTTTETTTGSGSSGATDRSGSRGRVRVPAGWERIYTSSRNTESIGYNGTYFIDGRAEVMNRNDIENSKTAQDVANYLMYNEMNMPAPMTVDKKLVAEIIKNNPSVFNDDGSVKEKPDWKKLDLPNREYLESNGYLYKPNPNDTNRSRKIEVDYDDPRSIKNGLEALGYKNVKVKKLWLTGNYDLEYTDKDGKVHKPRVSNDKMANYQTDIRGYFRTE